MGEASFLQCSKYQAPLQTQCVATQLLLILAGAPLQCSTAHPATQAGLVQATRSLPGIGRSSRSPVTCIRIVARNFRKAASAHSPFQPRVEECRTEQRG